MDTVTVDVELPRDVLGAMDVPEPGLRGRVKELLALELYREGRISSGKAAELADISKEGFVLLLSRHGLSYFSETPDELTAQVATTAAMIERQAR